MKALSVFLTRAQGAGRRYLDSVRLVSYTFHSLKTLGLSVFLLSASGDTTDTATLLEFNELKPSLPRAVLRD